MRQILVNTATALALLVGCAVVVGGTVGAARMVFGPTPTRTAGTTTPAVEAVPVKRYASIEAYFKDAYTDPLGYRLGEPWIQRHVSAKQKRAIKQRDGNACVVCGATMLLEVDHRRALCNGGDNNEENLATLCETCHDTKTGFDRSLLRKRKKLIKQKMY